MSEEKKNEEKRVEEKTVVKVKSSKFSTILIILVMVVSFVAGLFVGKSMFTVKIEEGMVTEQLRKCSELTTGISTMSGDIKIKEGDIPFITQKKYTMRYVAEVRAGVELKNVNPVIDGRTIKVVLPHSTILDISFPEKGLDFYNSNGALFNWRTQEDAKTGMAAARKKVEKEIKNSSVLKAADAQVVSVVKKLLAFAEKEGYKTEITFSESE